MLLLLLDLADRSPHVLNLRVLPAIRLCNFSKLPVLPLQAWNGRHKSDGLDVRVLRNEFGNLSPELDELKFAAQRLKIKCIPDPDFRRRSLDHRETQPEIRLRNL
jgi:hypothetical protein